MISPPSPNPAAHPPSRNPVRYRPNVCAVVHPPEGARVLLCRRADNTLGDYRWQFPQGGIQPGETPEQALLRELEEEIGTRRVAVLARAPQPVRYDFPPEVLALLKSGDPEKRSYIGQEQTWFRVRLLVADPAIRFDTGSGEFDAFRWVSPEDALAAVVPFKRRAYGEGLGALGLLPAEATC